MTLHLCLVNRDQIIVMSDRQLSVGGRPVPSDMTKTFAVHCAEGRGIVAFTGLARYGKAQTDRELMTVMSDNVESGFLMPAIGKIADGLAAWIDRLSVPLGTDTRLGVLVALWGYRSDGRVIPHLWHISNYESGSLMERRTRAAGRFKVAHMTSEADNPVLAVPIGQPVRFDPDDWRELIAMLGARKPREAMVTKGGDMMRAAARSSEAGGTIGDDFTVLALPSDRTAGVGVDWDVGSPTRVMHLGGQLDLVGGVHMTGVQVEQMTEKPWFVQRVGRNQPCPCGSGAKYKRCHGR